MEKGGSIFFDVVACFAFFLGGSNLVRVHIQKIARHNPGWGYSIVTLFGFGLMLFIGLFKLGNPLGIAGAPTEPGSWFQIIFQYCVAPLSATMYSLLAFFVASASYRAFRAKNTEATILLVAAFIILLGRTQLGLVMTSWVPDWLSIAQIPNLAVFIMTSPNLAGQRAIMIGIALGVVSMSLRLILGIERSYLGSDS
ncbi:MAG: hypothetical protein KAT58_00745 [candidate division Zixibacteria bacterium]|nr:hypothetical protein [candidate division Zixibacteria bacterium]